MKNTTKNKKGKLLFRSGYSETYLRASFFGLLFLMMFSTINLTFAINLNDVEPDNSDFIVQKSIWQNLVFSATSSGVVSGSPDEEKQIKLSILTSKLFYPILNQDTWIIFEYYEPKCNNEGASFIGDFIKPLTVMTSCDPTKSIYTLKKTNKVLIKKGTGKDSNGNGYLDTSNDFYNGVTHINMKSYYVLEETPVKQVEAKWLNYYTCGALNWEFRMWQNSDGSQIEKKYKQCGYCIDLGPGSVSCQESKTNPDETSLINVPISDIITDNNGDGIADTEQQITKVDETVPEIPTPILDYDSKTGKIVVNGTVHVVCKSNQDLITKGNNYYCVDKSSNNDTTSGWGWLVGGVLVVLGISLFFVPCARKRR